METRAIASEYRATTGEDGQRRLSWYPALFDSLSEDLGGFRERIGRRAFTQTVQADDIRALINHDPSQILGRTSAGTLALRVDLRGLFADVALPETSYTNDLLVNIANRNITGGSFMFTVNQDSWKLENVEGVEEPVLIRTLHDVRLYDVSPVTFPAYTATEGSASVRSLAAEWRQKLSGPPPNEIREMKEQMGMRLGPVVLDRYRRYLELARLKK